MPADKKIFYVQYTNPAAYPPLEHSSRMLARSGWEVTFLGIGVGDTAALEFERCEGVSVRRIGACGPGIGQKLHYLYFCVWVAYWALRRRPDWLYASELLSCPATLLARLVTGARVAYHEHDSPPATPKSRLERWLYALRRRLCAASDLCVLPNEYRRRAFVRTVGVDDRKTRCVWNCPRAEEALRTEHRLPRAPFVLYYHGSLNALRLPATLLEALSLLPSQVRLRIVGYETDGWRGYMTSYLAAAAKLGLEPGRVEYLGTLARRSDILAQARRSDLGLAFMPESSDDINMRHMAGASNKPFDYLACGIPLLVSDLPEWRDLFVSGGYARACDPHDARSLADAIRWFVERPGECARMGESGRQRVLREWNYEQAFAPVVERLESP